MEDWRELAKARRQGCPVDVRPLHVTVGFLESVTVGSTFRRTPDEDGRSFLGFSGVNLVNSVWALEFVGLIVLTDEEVIL